MTLFGKAIAWITKAVKTVKDLIGSGKIEQELENVVDIVNKIKQYADSPIADIIVKATPFTWDDAAKKWLSVFLTAVLDKYNSLKDAKALKEIAGKLAQRQTGLPLETASARVEETYQLSKLGV